METASADSSIRAGRTIGSEGCTRRGARAFQAMLAFATVWSICGQASAHLGHGIASGERRIELDIRERDVALGYSIGLATGATRTELESARARSQENSKLDELTAELVRAVEICAGETETSLACRPLEKKELESIDASGWGTDTLTIE